MQDKDSNVEYCYTTANSDWFKQRLTGAISCVVVAFIVLFIRLFYLQIIEGEEYLRLSENNCIRLHTIDPPRGLIFDRNGNINNNLLVDNRPSFDLNIVLKDAKPVEKTIEKLSHYSQIPKEELLEAIKSGKHTSLYKPIVLRKDISRELLASIEVHKYDLPGISVSVKPLRNYIYRNHAAHLLGYLSEINPSELKSEAYYGYSVGDFIGKFGVEKSYESFLRGKVGGQQVEVNATGQVVRILKTVDAVPGHNLLLTIDQVVQQKAEELLDGRAGSVVAMDPESGEILVMASSPSFDQNLFVSGMSRRDWKKLSSDPDRPMENKAIQSEYPPASTYKIITAIAGLEEGVIDENTTFNCPGYYRYGDRVFRCWKRGGHGDVDLDKALAESCDVYFYQVGQKLGVDRLAWYAKGCGLGSKTDIDLDHEGKGLIPSAIWKRKRLGKAWQSGETLSIAIGQGYNLVTPLQMLVMTAAIANGGVRLKPQILRAIETSGGKIVQQCKPEPIGKLPVTRETLEKVRHGLWEVVNTKRGTAYASVHMNTIDISGKTGTAQVFSRKQNAVETEKEIADYLKPHAWFVAYAPSEDPKIAVSVIIEHGEHGSSAAGPIAKEIIKLYLERELVVKPSKHE